jgi:DNA-binding ferritin-like protein
MDEVHLIQFVFQLLHQVKLYHWATMSYSLHKALDDLHGSLGALTDKLVESYIGKYHRQPLKKFEIAISVNSDVSLPKVQKFLESANSSLSQMQRDIKCSELQNIIDEIKGEIDNTLYLSRLA